MSHYIRKCGCGHVIAECVCDAPNKEVQQLTLCHDVSHHHVVQAMRPPVLRTTCP